MVCWAAFKLLCKQLLDNAKSSAMFGKRKKNKKKEMNKKERNEWIEKTKNNEWKLRIKEIKIKNDHEQNILKP